MKQFVVGLLLTGLLLTGCGSASNAQGIVSKYLAAKKWEDRLPYVKEADRVRPEMEKWYAGIPIKPISYDSMSENADPRHPGRSILTFKTPEAQTLTYYVDKTETGYKIDWEASVGHNPISWAQFQAERPTNPTRMRTVAMLSNYYNYEFSNAQKSYWAVEFYKTADGAPVHVAGYVKRDSADGQALFDLLKDGVYHRITVDIGFLPGGKQDGNVALITRYYGEGWNFQ